MWGTKLEAGTDCAQVDEVQLWNAAGISAEVDAVFSYLSGKAAYSGVLEAVLTKSCSLTCLRRV